MAEAQVTFVKINEAEELKIARTNKARQFELEAFAGEVQAAQWAEVAKEIPEAVAQADQIQAQAAAARKRATATHSFVGTKAADFKADLKTSAEDQRRGFEINYLINKDLTDNAEKYGLDEDQAKLAQRDMLLARGALKATAALFAEPEAAPAE